MSCFVGSFPNQRPIHTGTLPAGSWGLCKIKSAARSATMIVGALRLPLGIVRNIEKDQQLTQVFQYRERDTSESKTAITSLSAPILQVQDG